LAQLKQIKTDLITILEEVLDKQSIFKLLQLIFCSLSVLITSSFTHTAYTHALLISACSSTM